MATLTPEQEKADLDTLRYAVGVLCLYKISAPKKHQKGYESAIKDLQGSIRFIEEYRDGRSGYKTCRWCQEEMKGLDQFCKRCARFQ